MCVSHDDNFAYESSQSPYSSAMDFCFANQAFLYDTLYVNLLLILSWIKDTFIDGSSLIMPVNKIRKFKWQLTQK